MHVPSTSGRCPSSPGNIQSPLRRERVRVGLSQVALAAKAGCSIGTVSLAERGGFLTQEMARRFAAVLGCDPGELLTPGSPTSTTAGSKPIREAVLGRARRAP